MPDAPAKPRPCAALTRRGWLAAATAAAANAGLSAAVSTASAAVPPTPTGPGLRRGLNLSHWFEYEQGQDVSPAELSGLRALGLDHVRIPVDPVVGGWRPEAGGTRLSTLPALRAALEQALAAGLDAVVDLHLTADTQRQIEFQPALEQSLVSLWTQLGRALGDLPPARVAFELYNEPQYYGAAAARWPVLQARLLAALREQAPRHLAVLSGNEGGSLKGLRALPPVADAAVAYAFHYYEPFLFTHQGAHWLVTRYTTAGLRSGLRYPAAAQAGVRDDLDVAGRHARQHGLRLLCNEFGAIRAQVDPASRHRWMADVRQALEANGIGWTCWDYSDIFGITSTAGLTLRSAPRRIEAPALQALGLGPERSQATPSAAVSR
jgi:endoglucanase